MWHYVALRFASQLQSIGLPSVLQWQQTQPVQFWSLKSCGLRPCPGRAALANNLMLKQRLEDIHASWPEVCHLNYRNCKIEVCYVWHLQKGSPKICILKGLPLLEFSHFSHRNLIGCCHCWVSPTSQRRLVPSAVSPRLGAVGQDGRKSENGLFFGEPSTMISYSYHIVII